MHNCVPRMGPGMSQMTFFRGYSIPVGEEDRFFEEVKQHGIRPYSKSIFANTKPLTLGANTREELFRKEGLTTKDTRPEVGREEEYVFACGDYLGAAYYAKCHNKIPDSNAFVVQFTVNSINRVSVDGRDFFYNLVRLNYYIHSQLGQLEQSLCQLMAILLKDIITMQ